MLGRGISFALAASEELTLIFSSGIRKAPPEVYRRRTRGTGEMFAALARIGKHSTDKNWEWGMQGEGGW